LILYGITYLKQINKPVTVVADC